MYKVAINGFGRIGRNILRAYYEKGPRQLIKIVAINDLGSPEINAHLLKYDTTHGEFNENVSTDGQYLTVGDDEIYISSERDPAKLNWQDHDVDLVLECTGYFTDRESAELHIQAGAKKVLVSAPGENMDATIVYGVNDSQLTADHKIVSNASCTTNCLAPIADIIHSQIGITKGLVNTIHSYTNDQNLTDVYHTDMRRARAAAHSMIPSKTGAAAAIGQVIPALDGRLDGLAVRVPTLNVSLLDLTFTTSRNSSVSEINTVLSDAAKSSKIMQTNNLPLVSSDFNHNSASCVVDLSQTKVIDDFVKVLAWYDNEWGFSHRMLDTALTMMATVKMESSELVAA